MRIRTLACLSLVAGACAIAATGFPRRIGLTASQADVSLPGDLILPGANVVVDRGIALLPLSPSRTLLHIRERHEAQGRDRALAWAGVAAESASSLSMLRDLRDACVGGLVDA